MYSWYIENVDEVRRAVNQAVVAIGAGTVNGVKLGVREGAEEALRTRRWKDRTGETARKTRGYVTDSGHEEGNAKGVIECDVKHASFLADGTPAHEIRPRAWSRSDKVSRSQKLRAKDDVGTNRVALRWYDAGGDVHFAAVIHHPGTKPDAFMANGYLKAERVIIREVEIGVSVAQKILDA